MVYETSAARRRIMSSIRSKDTSPEKLLRSELHRRGLRFRLHVKDLPGKPDIVFRRRRVAIFVHGCFWHNHPECPWWKMPKNNQEIWKAKFKRNHERDEQHRLALVVLGWRPITLWECDIKRSPIEAADLVQEVLFKQAESNRSAA